jgi:hypothetical protein
LYNANQELKLLIQSYRWSKVFVKRWVWWSARNKANRGEKMAYKEKYLQLYHVPFEGL